mmetsp:Transcript_3677/g.7047  ORF Transcript_3677/g.7047 Transcript_3677/m.7047 type:complete len:90 (+) Transcript_3677:52-321(+)
MEKIYWPSPKAYPIRATKIFSSQAYRLIQDMSHEQDKREVQQSNNMLHPCIAYLLSSSQVGCDRCLLSEKMYGHAELLAFHLYCNHIQH